MYFLLLNPDVYRRLREEVDATFPPGDDPTDFAKYGDMAYLDACM